MADSEKSQKDLIGQLNKSDVKIDKEAADKMKDNILNDKAPARYLGLGVHDVNVTSAELVEARTGTMGMKFNVENEEGKSDVTMWLSEAALPYTIENVSRLVVHNASEKKKDEARNFMSNILSAKDLFGTVVKTLEDRAKNNKSFQCWLSIREDKNGSTYVNKDGETKPSLDRNLLPYEPKQTATQSVAKTTGGEAVDASDVPF